MSSTSPRTAIAGSASAEQREIVWKDSCSQVRFYPCVDDLTEVSPLSVVVLAALSTAGVRAVAGGLVPVGWCIGWRVGFLGTARIGVAASYGMVGFLD